MCLDFELGHLPIFYWYHQHAKKGKEKQKISTERKKSDLYAEYVFHDPWEMELR